MPDSTLLRRTVLIVALLNLGYFFIEASVAWAIGSVSLFADSVDFLEDTAVNLLIFAALGWPLARRAAAGRVMAGVILLPALAALVQAARKFAEPTPPEALSLILTAGGAVVVNTACSLLLLRTREHGGSLTRAAWLAARNDVVVNLGILLVGLVTLMVVRNGWPDLLLGIGIVALNLHSAREVWEVAGEERLAAKALAGEVDDDDDDGGSRWVSALLVVAVIGQLLALYLPGSPYPTELPIPGLDKVVHVVVFALPALLAWRLTRRAWPIVLLVAHAPVSELVQWRLVPHRSGDGWDLLADLLGIALGVWLAGLWRRRARIEQ